LKGNVPEAEAPPRKTNEGHERRPDYKKKTKKKKKRTQRDQKILIRPVKRDPSTDPKKSQNLQT